MTTDYPFQGYSHLQFSDFSEGKGNHTNDSTGAMDMVKRDRFELLSAYLDGEVTAAERKQVEQWLEQDPFVQRLYARLLKLRQGLRTMPVPQSQQPLEQTVQQVMARLRRRRLAWMCGGTAVAATVIAAVSSLLPNSEITPKLAQKQSIEQTQVKSEPVAAAPLMLAINNPIMAIPKAAESSPQSPAIEPQKQLKSWNLENDYH
jgi:negative regulator of sigma E activity